MCGLFVKKESTHFERDEAGRVKSVSRSGDVKRSRTPVSDALMKQAPRKQGRVSKWYGTYSKQRKHEREIYRKEYSRAREQGLRRQARSAGRSSTRPYRIEGNYNPFGSMFDTGMNYGPARSSSKKSSSGKYYVSGGKAYPIAGSKSKKRKSSKRRSSSGGFDIMDNWGFF